MSFSNLSQILDGVSTEESGEVTAAAVLNLSGCEIHTDGAENRAVSVKLFLNASVVLRRTETVMVKKNFIEKMFGVMLPKGAGRLKLSKMNMGGMGTAMMKGIMKDKNIDSLETMMKKAMENGVKIIACSMSMDVMGIRPEELIDGVEIGGVGTYLGDAEESDVNLFI